MCIEKNKGKDILSPGEVARIFGKSVKWVYRYYEDIGGVKLGGSIFFPSREDLYERLFS